MDSIGQQWPTVANSGQQGPTGANRERCQHGVVNAGEVWAVHDYVQHTLIQSGAHMFASRRLRAIMQPSTLTSSTMLLLLSCLIISQTCLAARVFNTSQGYRAQQFFGTDIRDPSRFGGVQWIHGFTANDYVDIVTYGEMLPTAVNLSVVLHNFSYCWHYRVDDAIPVGVSSGRFFGRRDEPRTPQAHACTTALVDRGWPSRHSASRCQPPISPDATSSVRLRVLDHLLFQTSPTALRFEKCLEAPGASFNYPLTYQLANSSSSNANWISHFDTSWVYSVQQRATCTAGAWGPCFPFLQPIALPVAAPSIRRAFQLHQDVRSVRKCHRLSDSRWPDDFTVKVLWEISTLYCRHTYYTLVTSPCAHHQVDIFLPNASSAQGSIPLVSTTLQPYRRTTATLVPPAPSQPPASVQVANRPRQPVPVQWLQDVFLFAVLNRKETYCPGTGTPQQALCRSNHGLGDGARSREKTEIIQTYLLRTSTTVLHALDVNHPLHIVVRR